MFLALREVAALPGVSDRKAHLLDRLELVWAQATAGREYTNKRGQELRVPDHATQLRVIEVAAELLGVKASEASARLVDLSVFNGGKAAEKQSA